MIPQWTQSKMDLYFEAYDAAKRHVGDAQGASVIVQELGKDLRRQEAKQQELSTSQPATPKQIAYLKDLGVEIPKDLTKLEASKLIDEALARDY